MTLVLAWALWISTYAHNDIHVTAYFQSQEECVRVHKLVADKTRWAQCIQANYLVPGKP